MNQIQSKILTNYDLSQHHSYQMSVASKYAYFLDHIKELKHLLQYFKKEFPNIPIRIIGEGTNIAFEKSIFEGLLIINKTKQIKIGEEFITIDSGVKLRTAIQQLSANGIEGIRHLEFIPGTVGAGLIGNVSRGPKDFVSLGDIVHSVVYFDKNLDRKIITRKHLKLKEKNSYFKNRKDFYILKIIFKYPKKYTRTEKFNTQQYIDKRKFYSSIGKTCGCYFNPAIIKKSECNFLSERQKEEFSVEKDIVSIPAGLLIDMANCKNMKLGGAYVSEKHANFLVNSGDATPDDLNTLALKIKRKVKEKFNVELTEEVDIL